VANYSHGSDWRESLTSWLNSPPPSGIKADNELFVQEAATLAPLSSLLSTVIMGADNLPRWTAVSDEDKHVAQLARIETMKMQLAGTVLTRALDRIKQEHDIPPLADLAIFLSEDGRGNFELANVLARSLIRYWSGDLEGALHTTVVRIESAARALVLLLNEPAYRVARSTRPNKYVGLDELLDILLDSEWLDENWDRFIRTLLLHPAGFTLRHNLAHGFVYEVPPAALVVLALRALGLFVTMLWAPPAQID
jgi:hypothetical protein